MISIVIPTYNEEKRIGALLRSIKDQTYKDYEVIVSDSESKDKTVEIAESYEAKVIRGKKEGVAVGRNVGACAAEGSILLFLDADTKIDPDFLQKHVKTFEDKKLGCATVPVNPMDGKVIDKIYIGVYNLFQYLAQYVDPHAGGFCIFATKEVFDKIGGFDRTITLAEDHAFARQSKRFGKFRIMSGPSIHMSMRRFDDDGRLNMIGKTLRGGFHRTFFGEIRHNRIKWEVGESKEKEHKD